MSKAKRDEMTEQQQAAEVLALAALAGVRSDGTGDLGIIARQALVEMPHSTLREVAAEVAEIVREARADAKAERELEMSR